jgi:hypothetical protein
MRSETGYAERRLSPGRRIEDWLREL